MQQALNQIAAFIGQALTWFGNFVKLVYNWSFGHIAKMFALPFANLLLWKQVLFVVVIAALLYLLYRIATDVLEAIRKVFSAVIGLLVAIFNQLLPVAIAGGIALGGAWVITNVTLPWLP